MLSIALPTRARIEARMPACSLRVGCIRALPALSLTSDPEDRAAVGGVQPVALGVAQRTDSAVPTAALCCAD
eukprot:4313333-Pleurochrysis_carterae.AAC.1